MRRPYRLQWGLENRGQEVAGRRGKRGADIAARGAWRHGKGRPEVVVAVVDSGVDLAHPDLALQLLLRPPGESWNFSEPGESLPRDPQGHGTHVAGIIAGAGSVAGAGTITGARRHAGIVGVAPGCRLLPLRVDLVNGGLDARADAIRFVAAKARADPGRRYVLNGSWKIDGPHRGIESALADAAAAGVVSVFPAGNGGEPHAAYPGRYPGVIAVAATDQCDRLWEDSNRGERVTLAAPGENIYSAYPTDFPGARWPYALRSGTSMAAAFVSGVAALVLSAAMELSVEEVRAILERSCDDVEAGEGRRVLGAGRVNARRAVEAALSLVPGSS